jgi:hypothetical protein
MGMMKRFLKEHDRMGRKVPVAQAYYRIARVASWDWVEWRWAGGEKGDDEKVS